VFLPRLLCRVNQGGDTRALRFLGNETDQPHYSTCVLQKQCDLCIKWRAQLLSSWSLPSSKSREVQTTMACN